jgi:hypothetical protein
MSRVRISIDRLVLKGFDPAQSKALTEGLQAELSRALADPGTRAHWAQSRRTPVMRVGQLSFGPGLSGARKLGAGVGRAIGRGVKP